MHFRTKRLINIFFTFVYTYHHSITYTCTSKTTVILLWYLPVGSDVCSSCGGFVVNNVHVHVFVSVN